MNFMKPISEILKIIKPEITKVKKIKIRKEFEFESAHHLPSHSGKCKSLHGHSYKLAVTIEGEINKNGMVMDFSDLRTIVKYEVVELLDHKYLNDVFDFEPTAEQMVTWIWDKLEPYLPLSKIELWETSESCAILTLE